MITIDTHKNTQTHRHTHRHTHTDTDTDTSTSFPCPVWVFQRNVTSYILIPFKFRGCLRRDYFWACGLDKGFSKAFQTVQPCSDAQVCAGRSFPASVCFHNSGFRYFYHSTGPESGGLRGSGRRLAGSRYPTRLLMTMVIVGVLSKALPTRKGAKGACLALAD